MQAIIQVDMGNIKIKEKKQIAGDNTTQFHFLQFKRSKWHFAQKQKFQLQHANENEMINIKLRLLGEGRDESDKDIQGTTAVRVSLL